MLKLKLKPKGREVTISLPEELSGKEVEIIILPVQERENQLKRIEKLLKKKPSGVFSSISDAVNWQRNLREEWER